MNLIPKIARQNFLVQSNIIRHFSSWRKNRMNDPNVKETKIGMNFMLLHSKLEEYYSKRELLAILKKFGENVTDPNETINPDVCEYLFYESGYYKCPEEFNDHRYMFKERPPPSEKAPQRPPIVTIMGHVDHGKTSLLDFFRKSNIVENEAGKITQHIGAFTVHIGEQKITFLDTPGHAAFLEMRHRGAQVTDFVILVVAANDGIQPQTLEPIKFIKEAKVPMIVAINKCDKFMKEVKKVKDQLLANGIELEEVGGDVQCIPISAVTGLGMDDLTQAIIAQAEIMDLRAEADGNVEGTIIESKTVEGKGTVATVLVRRGTIVPRTTLLAEKAYCIVRTMIESNSKTLTRAAPSTAVEIDGWSSVPPIGSKVFQVPDKEYALGRISSLKQWEEQVNRFKSEHTRLKSLLLRKLDPFYRQKMLEVTGSLKGGMRWNMDDMVSEKETKQVPKVNIVIKADVLGSIEAIENLLSSVPTNKIRPVVINKQIGPPTESDVELASLANAIIVNFNVEPPANILSKCQKKKVTIKSFKVIYHLIDFLNEELCKRIPIEYSSLKIGEAKVLKVFEISDGEIKAGGSITTFGDIRKTQENLYAVKVVRDSKVVYEGSIDSLKHFKQEVSLISHPSEFGISFKGFAVDVSKFENQYIAKPTTTHLRFRTDTNVPKLGVMLVGWGGNNGSTFTAGILANKMSLKWQTRRGLQNANYLGSVFMSSTMVLGPSEEDLDNLVHVPMNSLVPMVNPNEIVIGGWDISSMNLADAMDRAQVLEPDLKIQLKDAMGKMKPLPSIYYPDFIAANQVERADNVIPGTNKNEHLEVIRNDIRQFKKANDLDKVIVMWTANTERFSDVKEGLNDTAESLLTSIKESKDEISPSSIFAVASILEGCPFINGSPQNTLVPGVIDLATQHAVPIGGDDFKTGQTKIKSVLVDFLVNAGIKPLAITSYNHLGNNDGANLSAPKQFRSKEITKSSVVDDMVKANFLLYSKNEHPDHTIVIKNVPSVGDSKRALDEYENEIFMGGRNTISLHNTCEDSLLAVPVMIDLIILMELFTRVTYKTECETEFKNFNVVNSFLSYFLKAPMVPYRTPVINALQTQRRAIENVLRALLGLPIYDDSLLHYRM
ncbi:hypothetical protein ROZALSC1DRAFT_27639 [Rozella allomycis CSF55]|uniref:Inositol-3-phosphate synthase n=1 Tax=Rozella allomycis (strain CSF55) TaxID=988480 RepID=A0A4P9YMI0_ROZAC|nr:hypothetical protein ROZALSC1DRAFT_27639 [Rozella allomycis CSF55]